VKINERKGLFMLNQKIENFFVLQASNWFCNLSTLNRRRYV